MCSSLSTVPPSRVGKSGEPSPRDEVLRQLHRLVCSPTPGTFVLWLLDGRRVEVSNLDDIHVNRSGGTIDVTIRGDVCTIPSEELLAIELRPRCAPVRR